MLGETTAESPEDDDSVNLRNEHFSVRSESGLVQHFQSFSGKKEEAPVFRVVLTGGPCAGKTTAMSILEDRMRIRGFRTFLVPEAATLLIDGGAQFEDLSTDQRRKKFQAKLLQTQMSLENTFYDLAKMCGVPSILICDRGAMDGSAYMPRPLWLEMLAENGWNEVMLRDRRYEAVLHLITAADGAKEFYTLETNKTRRETPDEAILMDRKLRNAWIGHPRLRVIDNRSDFYDKMNRLVNAVYNLVALPQTPEVSRKFVVRGDISQLIAAGGLLQEFDVDQTILETRQVGVQESVRRRGRGGVYSYVHRVRKKMREDDFVEVKRGISEPEYRTLLSHADGDRKSLHICRRCFLYMDMYYILDEIKNIDPPLVLLRTQTESMETPLDLPPFVELEKEVTNDKTYTVHELSKLLPARKSEHDNHIKNNVELPSTESTGP